MNKWRVRIEGAGGWAVFNPDRGSKRWFPTHAEALAYADKRARTREVVLPRDTARPSEYLEICPMYWGAVVTTVDDGARLLLNLKEIRPLALALLAHAERMEE